MQITLYHQEACEAVDEDSLLELCDWGYRKLLALNSKQHKQTKCKPGHMAAENKTSSLQLLHSILCERGLEMDLDFPRDATLCMLAHMPHSQLPLLTHHAHECVQAPHGILPELPVTA